MCWECREIPGDDPGSLWGLYYGEKKQPLAVLQCGEPLATRIVMALRWVDPAYTFKPGDDTMLLGGAGGSKKKPAKKAEARRAR